MTENKAVQTTKTEKVELILNGQDILDLIAKAAKKYKKNIDNKKSISISVTIPSGGDYSGQELDIDDSMPVKVVIESEITKTPKTKKTDKQD